MTANCRSKSTARLLAPLAGLLLAATGLAAQPPAPVPPNQPVPVADARPAAVVVPPPDYVIGADDVLGILYWKDESMTSDVQVRPDGRIALPLVNEIVAAGLTPEQLRETLTEESRRFMEDPSITVVVRQINSRRVYITGEVGKPGPYALTGPMTVLQLIATAGGLREYANDKRIVIMRTVNGRATSLRFNYRDVVRGRNLRQNIDLRPGDTVVVP